MKPAGSLEAFDRLDRQKPDMASVENQMRRARLHLRLAMNKESAHSALLDMQQVYKQYQTSASLADIQALKTPDNDEALAALAFFDQADIDFAHQLQQFYAALLSSRYRPFLEEQYGLHLFEQASHFRRLIRPEVLQDLHVERLLVRQYQQIMRDLRFTMKGQTMNRHVLQRYLHDPDRHIRQQAYQAYAEGMAALGDPLDEHFTQLLHCRQQIAQKLGFASKADLAWQRMPHHELQRSGISELRALIQRYVLPLTREIRHLQRRRLSLDQLDWSDQFSLLTEGLPRLQMTLEQLVPSLADVIVRQSDMDFAFRRLQDAGYINIIKAGSAGSPGVATSMVLTAVGLPCTCLCSDGSALDLLPVLQQLGYAFASTCYTGDLVEYSLPEPLVVQTQGYAMALLLLPHLETAFGITHDDYQLLQLSQMLLDLTQDCMVDDFEEQLYAGPNLTAAERCQLWLDLERSYMPDLNHEHDDYFAAGRTWQLSESIWLKPYSQIGRTLALLPALDLWRLSKVNPTGAWRRYTQFCSYGSQMSFVDLLKKADLASPLDPITIKRVAYAVCNDLSL